jgi:hypothetical protein
MCIIYIADFFPPVVFILEDGEDLGKNKLAGLTAGALLQVAAS